MPVAGFEPAAYTGSKHNNFICPVVCYGMQLKFPLHHGLQYAVVDEGKHVEACNKRCDVAR